MESTARGKTELRSCGSTTPHCESPQIETVAHTGIEAKVAVDKRLLLIVNQTLVGTAYQPREPPLVVPHKTDGQTIRQRHGIRSAVARHETLLQAEHRRFAYTYQPMAPEHPVVGIAELETIIVAVHMIGVIVPLLRQPVAHFRWQTAEIEIIGIVEIRDARKKRALAA